MAIDVPSLLSQLGYHYSRDSGGYRMVAIHREGANNPTAFKVFDAGNWCDFVTGEKGSIRDLLKLHDFSDSEVNEILGGKAIHEEKQESVKKQDDKKYFDNSILENLLPSYSFYNKRGISTEVLKLFEGGMRTFGKMNNRFVFPIFDCKKRIVGVSGRDLLNSKDSVRPKWKHLGAKKHWVYPAFLNKNIVVEAKEVILVESIGDMLALWESGIKNVWVAFGCALSEYMISTILACGVNKVFISTNNDAKKEKNTGLEAAVKMRDKLRKYYGENSIVIALPTKGNDFGKTEEETIDQWKERVEDWRSKFLK